jgi:hypothetical protein
MKRRIHSLPITVGSAALCLLLANASAAFAQPPVVLSAAINRSVNQIAIGGQNLQPTSGPPTVTLDGVPLVVVTLNPTTINAGLPPALGFGTFLLIVDNGSGSDSFEVTTPIAGPQGPAGPRGLKGAAGATGPQGATGPAGTISLPFLGGASTKQPVFQISNGAVGAEGIEGSGGPGSGSTGPLPGGNGVEGDGGVSSGGFGGIGVLGQGGPASNTFDEGGVGGSFFGGGNDSLQVNAAAGLLAQGGNSAGGFAGVGIFAVGGSGPSDGLTYGVAGYFAGNATVSGNLSKAGGSFVIDHPADPANKYLYHSFVESPDMMNVYNGNITTDGGGNATVTLPDWFETLNRDFRYQLTTIGQLCQATVASKVLNNTFTIKTDKPNVEVSWQVTGIRQDAWANAHRIPLEVDKAPADQGHYLHPELFGHEGEPSIADLHNPHPKKQQQQ